MSTIRRPWPNISIHFKSAIVLDSVLDSTSFDCETEITENPPDTERLSGKELWILRNCLALPPEVEVRDRGR